MIDKNLIFLPFQATAKATKVATRAATTSHRATKVVKASTAKAVSRAAKREASERKAAK